MVKIQTNSKIAGDIVERMPEEGNDDQSIPACNFQEERGEKAEGQKLGAHGELGVSRRGVHRVQCLCLLVPLFQELTLRVACFLKSITVGKQLPAYGKDCWNQPGP